MSDRGRTVLSVVPWLCHGGAVARDDVLLREGLSDAEAGRLVVLMASAGIEATLQADSFGSQAVWVRGGEADAARRLLADEARHAEPAEAEGEPESRGLQAGWFGRGSTAVLLLAAVCVAAFVHTISGGDATMRARLLDLGAIERSRIAAGETWRFATAVFLHFDIGHLLANLAVLIVVGPPLAHQIGPARFVLVFLASGVGGNVASHLLAPTFGLKAGASGAIAGVLGALGGRALGPGRSPRRKAWHTLAALAALYGLLIGFGPRSDHVAHFAGLLCGLALGWRLGGGPPALVGATRGLSATPR